MQANLLRRSCKIKRVYGTFLTVFGGLLLLGAVCVAVACFIFGMGDDRLIVAAAGIFLSVGALSVGVLLLCLAESQEKYRVAEIDAQYRCLWREKTEPTVKALREEIGLLKEDVRDYTEIHGDLLSLLAEEDRTPYAVGLLLRAVKDQRVGTLNEALVLLKDEKRWMEQKSEKERDMLMRHLQRENLRVALSAVEANRCRLSPQLRTKETLELLRVPCE